VIDSATFAMLQDVPADLKARGWEPSRGSTPTKTLAGARYKAVYARPFDRGVDDERFTNVIHRNGGSVVIVSTRSASWENDRQEAIVDMRVADGRRGDISSLEATPGW